MSPQERVLSIKAEMKKLEADMRANNITPIRDRKRHPMMVKYNDHIGIHGVISYL